MKRVKFAAAVIACMLGGTAALASAEVATWKFDQAHSEAAFSIRHFFSAVQGRFQKMDGSIVFDDKDWSKSSVEATIDAGTIFTNNERRDSHLRTPDFFDVADHPTLTFKSTKVTPGKGNDFLVEGDLTMRGVTRRVVLEATFLGAGDVGQMGTKAGFTAKTMLSRKDYGINWNKTLDNGGVMLGDDVAITLNIEANKVPTAAAGADAR